MRVGSSSLHVIFQEVSEDSRCPSDVTCIWAGQAVVAVALQEDGANSDAGSLTVGMGVEAVKNIGGYLVEALALGPQPVSTAAIDAADYILTLEVSPS